VHFIQITAIIFRLLQIIEENSVITVVDCLNKLSSELNHSNPEMIQTGGLQTLQELFSKSIVGIC
jgi:hypothetical protein